MGISFQAGLNARIAGFVFKGLSLPHEQVIPPHMIKSYSSSERIGQSDKIFDRKSFRSYFRIYVDSWQDI